MMNTKEIAEEIVRNLNMDDNNKWSVVKVESPFSEEVTYVAWRKCGNVRAVKRFGSKNFDEDDFYECFIDSKSTILASSTGTDPYLAFQVATYELWKKHEELRVAYESLYKE